ncbi:MAG TPA: trypsin-like peptidase domain-containing protein [Bacillota bacterium]|nr:trypsin-like peptidase domain-containing protein [Bacillota bacterium]
MSINDSNWRKSFGSYVLVAVVSVLITGLVFFHYAGDSHTFAATGVVTDESASSASDIQIAQSSLVSAQLPSGYMSKDSIANVAERVGRAVVNIDTKRTMKVSPLPFGDFFYEFFGIRQQDMTREVEVPAIGSGFIVRSDGYVLTNNHVIEGAKEIVVTLADGRKFNGKTMGRDPRNDLAIVKIDAKDLPAVQLGDSDKIRPGDFAIAIGNPYGLQHTVTAGIISGLARSLDGDPKEPGIYIQTDAAINRGNSGGPLIDIEGRVVGINTAIIPQAQGLGFAIPVNVAKSVMDDLISGKKIVYPWIGVQLQNLTPELAEYFGVREKYGAVVAYVYPNSPAEKAGLQEGDIILRIGNAQVTNITKLQEEVRNRKAGDKAVLQVWRNNSYMLITVTLGEMPDD